MPRKIIIDPVTRIEGHAKISIYLDDTGQVSDARFHVTEFRGFEKFCEGRPLWEMPGITARVCGICPVSHLLASAKAGDRILSVTIPKAAEKLRRLMNLAQIIQSHSLSFFHLSAPDLLLGMDSDPAKRNIFGLIAAEPELARGGIRLRQFGQEIIEQLGGQKIHPSWAVPGGVREALSPEGRTHIQNRIPEARTTILNALSRFKELLNNYQQEAQTFGNFPSLFMGLVTPEGLWENYDGNIRFVDSAGNIIADQLDPTNYQEFIGEAVESHSYLKFPYYRPLGYPDQSDHCNLNSGIYRVGPLARLNICSQIGTPLADVELREYRDRGKGTVNSSFFYHYARLIEILASIERIEILLDDPDLLSNRLRAEAGINQLSGVGVSEAPRGTLFHHYQVDENGLMQKVNLIIATGQNNLGMNRTVAQIARHFINGAEISQGILNRVEAGIRAFDPCLSCSTHAAGQMPLHIQLIDKNGSIVNEVWRE
ncbi:Ni/Fe hydrogenase subunit alpha [Nodularia spumigena CS-584]|jgi:NAD-reducing hydrogenase large subunit|uniref:NAD-reducing hydrogenase HoxS subunit beta n=2 Tax=Nodularia spumigena TaxID=70799 RepID=A0A2S0QAU4_NODSP|nr:Ni/Fe hydrogenase subunit alpha [Nodularia spumigena]AHJ29134.1 NAD-reducing hydrogenase subunit HoxH [Nodularia spumigena CCY9414]AVZ31482.1 NAD-reducing hydrogenase HoxS subunit beta [Nodularia spumigena UHCC 0039]EAW45903.1 Nickel-dependent hydrogenase, large subunit [Nodularia spumigena CCY9414]MDB9382713.1 Ni/Fe hydrogenase subunit alpha [Nodularia spumigena CS-584]MEA5525157.1 Ni/Fe hydrogenase subunit alpha [Nodularia spumigena UHCC 0143]